MDWYVLFVETGKEEITKDFINKKLSKSNIRCIIPKRKVPEKKQGITYHCIKLMFPGYVLIELKLDYKIYYQLKEIPTLIRLLNYNSPKYYYTPDEDEGFDESDCFKKINSKEMQFLIKLIGDEGILDYSELFIENSNVTVLSGPLKNREGIIKRVDKHKNRAKVEFNFLDRVCILDVGVQILYTKDDRL
ncbi:antiterminator LoaP [Paenibacillus alba]|uniref:antiterminator LoaP n=1 Tax=Paenibacillus alba TaxID=1197127 RepID=UPI0015669E0A|nr:antiterminator LoaP [Paenibacillus alba]NQX71563.1 antiterminator LoaP [Paenibacillus alba]